MKANSHTNNFPGKIPQKTLFPSIKTRINCKKPLPKAYMRLRNALETEEIPYKLNLFLRQIVSQACPSLSKPVLHTQLVTIQRELLLNELEVSVWSLYLARAVWKMEDARRHMGLYFAGLAAKKYFDPDLEPFEEYLDAVFVDFGKEWRVWMEENEGNLEVLPQELRNQYGLLSFYPVSQVKLTAIDYNKRTEEILALAPVSEKTHLAVLSLEDRESGVTTPSGSESDLIREMEGQFGYWEATPKLTSLTEIWPELSSN